MSTIICRCDSRNWSLAMVHVRFSSMCSRFSCSSRRHTGKARVQCQSLKPIFHCDVKYLASGVGVGQCPRCQNFALEPTQSFKFASPPTPSLKFALPPTPTPDASQWNIGDVGSPTREAGIGHVHFMFFCVDFICVGHPTQTRFQWNMGFKQMSFTCIY